MHLLNLNTVVTQVIWTYQCPEMASMQIYVGIFSTIFLHNALTFIMIIKLR